MARPPKGKPLTLRPIRLDDDVWAECQRLGKEHGTINEGLREKLVKDYGTGLGKIPDVLSIPPMPLRPFKGPLLKPKERK